MSYLETTPRPDEASARAFGFKVEPSEAGWRWTAFDLLGEVAEQGVAPTKAIAAACVIRALART